MTERALNDIIEFNHVIEVREDGSIINRPDIFAPDLNDDELLNDSWSLLNGWSGQDRYSGPMMHASEYVGGGLERWIRENPGVYVTLVNYLSPDENDAECEHCGRRITGADGVWIDPEATGDDAVWRETCDAHDTFTAEHEPVTPEPEEWAVARLND